MTHESVDGADLGLDAETSMRAVIGGVGHVPPGPGMTPAEMRAYLESCPGGVPGNDAAGYERAARWLGQQMLATLDAHPERWHLDTDALYDATFRARRSLRGTPGEGCTGFQVGWAANAARYALELPPKNNPAIITLGGIR